MVEHTHRHSVLQRARERASRMGRAHLRHQTAVRSATQRLHVRRAERAVGCVSLVCFHVFPLCIPRVDEARWNGVRIRANCCPPARNSEGTRARKVLEWGEWGVGNRGKWGLSRYSHSLTANAATFSRKHNGLSCRPKLIKSQRISLSLSLSLSPSCSLLPAMNWSRMISLCPSNFVNEINFPHLKDNWIIH